MSGAVEFYLFEDVLATPHSLPANPPLPDPDPLTPASFSHSRLPSEHGKKSSLPGAASSHPQAP